MEDDLITRHEHEEFCKRMEEEHTRINHRVQILEDDVRDLNALTNSVNKLATSVEYMCQEQAEQSDRLKKLESVDGEKWRNVTACITTAIVGGIVGYLLTLFF